MRLRWLGAPPPLDRAHLACPPRTTRARAPPLHQGPELEQHSRITWDALLPCVRALHVLHVAAPAASLQAVRKKYSQEKQGAVSGIPPLAQGFFA